VRLEPLEPEKESRAPTLDRLGACIESDRALRLLAAGHIRADGGRLLPSGLDAAACCVARSLLGSASRPAAALAVPRGATGLPALVGLYLVMQRWGLPHLHGNVLVATARGELSAQMRQLTVEGAPFERMKVGRLVSRPKAGTGGVQLDGTVRPPDRQAMMRSLDRSSLRGLSQNDGYLLFARPGSIPPMPAPGVLTFAVIDTVGASRPARGNYADADSPDAWSAAHRALGAAGARALWVGELGDQGFEAFCAARGIPLVRAGWPLVEQCAELGRFGAGGPLLSSHGLCQRALERPPLKERLVHDPDRVQCAREAYTLLANMRRRAHGGPLPGPVRAAYDLLSLTSRLACDLDVYERAAAVGSPVFNRSATGLRQELRRADSSHFRGRWKEAYRRYWDALVGVLNALWRIASEEPAKLVALYDEVAAAERDRVELVVCCQTETERRAVSETLAELDAAGVTVTTFRRHAPAGDGRVVLLGPPPPWHAPALLSGEQGEQLVLCYAYEEPKLREAIAAAELRFGDDRENAAALDALGFAPRPLNGWRPPLSARLVELEPFGSEPESDDVARPEPAVEVPDPGDDALWRELVDLWGSDIEEEENAAGAARPATDAAAGYSGVARIVQFLNAPPVALRDDSPVDVLTDADGRHLEDLVSKLPGALESGERIAFLPGVEQHSLRDALMAAWDATLASERELLEPLWRAAIARAVEQHGIYGLARICYRDEATIRTWVRGTAAPQQVEVFELVLGACGLDAAWQARAPMWRLMQAMRTMHRIIGKKLRAAIVEALSDYGDQPAVRELEALTKTSLGDLLDIAEALVVARVGPPRRLRLADCGHYLPHDHPLLEGEARP